MFRSLSWALALALFCATQSFAGLMVTVQDQTITAGGDATVDVVISSSDPALLASAIYGFRIDNDTNLDGNPTQGTLAFLAGSTPGLFANTNYLFYQNSSDELFGFDPLGPPGTPGSPGLLGVPSSSDTYNNFIMGSDTTAAFDDLTFQGDKLLVQLKITTKISDTDPGYIPSGQGVQAQAGDRFRISVVALSATDDPTVFQPTTYFQTGDQFFTGDTGADFGVQSGLITVVTTTAVPEPSTVASVLAGLPIGAFFLWRKARKVA